MLATGDDNIAVYDQIIDLQKKLKQSEAERIRLEEMFNLLMKTLKEEEEMQLKSVENRYHAFLEDCARRNNRNEKILRSVERIESAANVLHAKSERLKLLRNYYEGYLERIIPSWKQASLCYGPSQFSYNELDWMRRRQLISMEIPENTSPSFYSANYAGSKSLCLNGSNDYRLVSESERKPFNRFLTNNWNNFNKNFWMQANKENEWGNKLGEHHTMQKNNGDLTLPSPLSTNKLLGRPNEFQCDSFEKEPEQKNKKFIKAAEPAFPQNILLENDWELEQKDLRQQNVFNLEKNNCSENSCHILSEDDQLNKSRRLIMHSEDFRKKETFDKRKEKKIPEENIRAEKQLIVREPVEIKKPELMVGKLHPDVTMTFENLKKIPQHENLKKENLDKKIESVTEPERIFIPHSHEDNSLFDSSHSEDMKIESKNKWSLLKQKDNIDILKETLAENQIDLDKNTVKIINSIQNLSLTECESLSKIKAAKTEMENNDKSEDKKQSVKFLKDKEETYEGQKIIFADEDYELKNDDEKNELGVKGDINKPEGQFNNELFQKESICDSVEEVYEDNEESYPESYFEQPPKSHFPTNIVSNVILEEDESEVNSNDTGAEIECNNLILHQKNVEDEKYERAAENLDDINKQNGFDKHNSDDTQKIFDNPNLFENIVSDERNIDNDQMNFYPDQNNYQNSFQEQSAYESSEMNDGGYLSNEQNNHITVEHQAANSFNELCFEDRQSQEIENRNTEIIGERQIYQDQLSNENLEITPVIEHYVNDMPYQIQYCEQPNNNILRGVYYEQEAMNDEHFQNNLEQNNEFEENQEGTENFLQIHNNQNLPYGESVDSRQSVNHLAHLLESDSESFQMEHGSGIGNEDSDFDFSISHQK